MADLVKLSVDTESATPAAAQQAATPATTPNAVAAPAAKVAAAVPAVNTVITDIEKLLKKNNFESREPRTLSEQLAHDRDIVDEGLGSAAVKGATWLGKNLIAPTAKFAYDNAVKPIGQGIANNIIAPAARLTTQAATLGGIGYGGWKGFEAWRDSKAPVALNAADQAEFTRLMAELKQLVPNEAAFKALPPDVQKKLDQLTDRAIAANKLTTGTQ
jgi:hypothetical protein